MTELLNQKFNRLTPIEYLGVQEHWRNKRKMATYLCKCDCGKEITVPDRSLKSGNTGSCGCIRNDSNTRHGHTLKGKRSKIYNAWVNMRSRCEDQSDNMYYNYGAKGIKVCNRWQSFDNFLADMGEPDSPDLTLERLCVYSGYSPENCVWADRFTQSRNRTDNCYIEYKGVLKCQTDWAKEFNIPQQTLSLRLRSGWDIERALTKPTKACFKPRTDRKRKTNSSSAQAS